MPRPSERFYFVFSFRLRGGGDRPKCGRVIKALCPSSSEINKNRAPDLNDTDSDEALSKYPSAKGGLPQSEHA